MEEPLSITVRPIGLVRNNVEGPDRPEWSMVESKRVIDPRWEEAILYLKSG